MALKPIKTPVLKYWGFLRHPFDDYILNGGNLQLFVNRNDELHHLYNALTNRFNGIYGAHGIGKSSFLRQFQTLIEKDKISTIYIHLTGTTEKALYREILAGLLQAHINRKIKTKKSWKLNDKHELNRVNISIKQTQEVEFGSNVIVKSSLNHSEEKEFKLHTEESARQLIANIVSNATTSFVLIIDDFERLKLFVDNQDTYCNFVSAFIRTVDELFVKDGISFVASLDAVFVERMKKNASSIDDDPTFSFGELIKVPTFPPQEFLALIKKRLNFRTNRKSIKKFITKDAFWLLMLGSGGHPRRALGILRSAMEYVELKKKVKMIDAEVLVAGLEKRNEKVNIKDVAIVEYLAEKGPASPSDKNFQNIIKIKKAQLWRRLEFLVKRIKLQQEEVRDGKTTKFIYSLPDLDYN